MKKILSFIIAFAMIMSMSSVALAAGETCADPSTCSHAAAVGDKHYSTLKDAIKEAKSGDEIILLTDYTESDTTLANKAPIQDGVTINGNGKTLNITENAYWSASETHFYNHTGSVTIKNLKINNTSSKWALDLAGGTVENCEFTGEGIIVYGLTGSTLNIVDCVFNGNTNIYPITTDNSDETALKISGCTFNTNTNGYAVILRNENSEFIGNTVYTKVNALVSNIKIEENTFYSRLKFYTDSGNSASNNVFETSATVELDKATNTVTLTGNTWKDTAYKEKLKETAGVEIIDPAPAPKPASSGSGISVKYNGGNSFSTSKSDVPTGVEIDGVAVPFTGDGKLFTVNSIPAGAKWVTVRWNSTSVTTNFTPSGAYAAQVEIPKTGDMPLRAAVLAVFGF